jgi:fatty-acyl-CoA synthase
VVAVPDEQWGEVGHLFVVLKQGSRADTAAILACFDGVLARFKVPKQVSFLNALPRNSAGKVAKIELRKISAASQSAAELE